MAWPERRPHDCSVDTETWRIAFQILSARFPVSKRTPTVCHGLLPSYRLNEATRLTGFICTEKRPHFTWLKIGNSFRVFGFFNWKTKTVRNNKGHTRNPVKVVLPVSGNPEEELSARLFDWSECSDVGRLNVAAPEPNYNGFGAIFNLAIIFPTLCWT